MSKIDKKIEVNSFSVNVTCWKTFCLFPRQLKTNGFVKYFFYLVTKVKSLYFPNIGSIIYHIYAFIPFLSPRK